MTPAGAGTLPSSETLLGRLDQIDLRLRQLEEKQWQPESYFTTDLRRAAARPGHHQCISMPSALHDVHLKGSLMDRLHLLETRIRQLSFELDKGSGVNASTSSTKQMNENRWSEPVILEKRQPVVLEKKQDNSMSSSRVAGGAWRTGEIFQRGPRDLQGQKTKMKVKEPKEAISDVEKRSAMYRNEKRRLERTRLYRRWFPVGC
uniref:Uncharacterized protein LOC105053292 n=1 Tax=Elaeis guineensis var. tenera TaxID=51953 RepID=A0A6J0PNG8_ELAGV|nr:uncharacterized protein LOC105053292 [Elaeis guineensis]